jgi:O-antigen ligase
MKTSLVSKSLFIKIITWCAFALILTLIFIRFSPLIALAALIGIFLIFAVLKRPEIALIGILIITSSIIFENQLPSINVGPITLLLSDLLLLGCLALIAARSLVEPKFKIVRTPLDWPLIIFIGLMLLSTIIAISNKSLEYSVAIAWVRIMSYYLTFFIVTNLVHDQRQLNFLINGIFVVAVIVAGAVVGQFLLGDSVQLISGRVQDLSSEGAALSGLLRIAPPGLSTVLVSFITLICIVVVKKTRSIRFPEILSIGLMGMALLLTFLRSMWAAIIMVLSLLMVLVRGKDRQRMIRWGLVIICLIAIILLIIFINPDSRAARLVGALMDRYGSLTVGKTFQGQDSSLNWRMLENKYAISSISAHPLIGIGMGARYRPFDRRLTVYGDTYDYRMHIHNGYLWILLDMGILGFLAFIWLSITFLNRGFRNWRSITNDRFRGVMLGFSIVYLAALIAAVANSTFTQWRWTPLIGILFGINEVIHRENKNE